MKEENIRFKFPLRKCMEHFPIKKRTDPVHRSSHTRWGLGRDYRNLVLPLQSAMQRGWFEPRTSWHKWGGLHHCARPALYAASS